ncbi:fibroblast growth factor 23 [Triplophysa rosa]|uniref:Fibroblast growth factor 23 n=1 Tax=Triplophysa rosa TaxID=992332 RepID=A0A9W7T915_TRIRA|nr:fibroblast growth factor 23 [Triplophysa rosa]KAI7792143.1 fibroblast growth factor 23 precursor [Triplophysa rosa]
MRCALSNLPMLQSSILALWLTALQGFRPADTAPNPSPLLGSNWGNPRRFIHLQTTSDLNNFYLEISSNGHVRKTTHRGSYSVILLKAETRDRLAIFGVKSNRFMCMDAGGTIFTSTVCNKDDCLFHHKLLENNRDVYYSSKNNILLNLDGAKQVYTAGQNLPQSSLFLSEKNTISLERLQHRERRNRQVNPSDPLNALRRGEGSDSRAVQEDDGDFDFEPSEGHNISRETLVSPSDDDPWDLVQDMSPSSPRIAGIVG